MSLETQKKVTKKQKLENKGYRVKAYYDIKEDAHKHKQQYQQKGFFSQVVTETIDGNKRFAVYVKK